jgi:hypothetical protein
LTDNKYDLRCILRYVLGFYAIQYTENAYIFGNNRVFLPDSPSKWFPPRQTPTPSGLLSGELPGKTETCYPPAPPTSPRLFCPRFSKQMLLLSVTIASNAPEVAQGVVSCRGIEERRHAILRPKGQLERRTENWLCQEGRRRLILKTCGASGLDDWLAYFNWHCYECVLLAMMDDLWWRLLRHSVGMDSVELWFPPNIFFSRLFFPLFFPSFIHFNHSVRCGWFLLTVAKVFFFAF